MVLIKKNFFPQVELNDGKDHSHFGAKHYWSCQLKKWLLNDDHATEHHFSFSTHTGQFQIH